MCGAESCGAEAARFQSSEKAHCFSRRGAFSAMTGAAPVALAMSRLRRSQRIAEKAEIAEAATQHGERAGGRRRGIAGP